MKTDYEKWNNLRQMIKTYIPYNITHKILSIKDNIDEDDMRDEWVKFYISDEYVSIMVNDWKEYIKSEICINQSWIDIKTLKKWNFLDIKFPDFDYLTPFIEKIIKANKSEIENWCSETEENIKKQIEELNRQLKYLQNK